MHEEKVWEEVGNNSWKQNNNDALLMILKWHIWAWLLNGSQLKTSWNRASAWCHPRWHLHFTFLCKLRFHCIIELDYGIIERSICISCFFKLYFYNLPFNQTDLAKQLVGFKMMHAISKIYISHFVKLRSMMYRNIIAKRDTLNYRLMGTQPM